jgi:hypothetical protein
LKATEKKRAGSGSVIQWYGYTGLDPYQNVMDPDSETQCKNEKGDTATDIKKKRRAWKDVKNSAAQELKERRTGQDKAHLGERIVAEIDGFGILELFRGAPGLAPQPLLRQRLNRHLNTSAHVQHDHH